MKAFPLQTLLDLSNVRMDDAARRLGEFLASEHEVSKTLDMLIQYRNEYEDRFRQAAQSGITREEWRNYQSFLARLDTAIAHQRSLADLSHQRTTEGQKEWLDKRNRVKAFDTLSQRHQQREVRVELKGEQRIQDEHAARHHGHTDD